MANRTRRPHAVKPDQTSENDLSNVLAQWKVGSALPPGFQDRVWQRIGASEVCRAEGALDALIRWIDSTFCRPKFAVSYLTVLLLVGLGAGYWQAQDKSAHSEAKWRALYVQSVDPYRAPGH